MIVAIGVDVDDTFVRFVHQTVEANVPVRAINLRVAVDGEWRFDVPPLGPAVLRYDGEVVHLEPQDAFFCRLIDLSSQLTDVEAIRRWQGLVTGLRMWLDAIPGRVVNRLHGGAHNSSKPLHETVLRDWGFSVPETITSSDVAELRQFIREAPAVSKTVCGVRADTEAVSEVDFDGFEPSNGPVHLQRLVSGSDARIHVIGDQVVAQRVSANGVDYRRAGSLSEMKVFDPPEGMRKLLVEGTRKMRLAFAGWDFKIDENDVYWCLEANPMPGYGPYDNYCEGSISRELTKYLQGSGLNV